MDNIKVLDCTLRDGGFINNWNFGNDKIISIFQRLLNAGIDIIELGFLDDRVAFDINRSITPGTKELNKIYRNGNYSSMLVGMIDYGTCALKNIQNAEDNILDGLRVIFKKKDLDHALEYCEELINRGYKVFVQPVSVTTYSKDEIVNLIKKVNQLNPYAMSIVDTYGLLHKDGLLEYFNLLNSNLNDNITIGYHAHNNFQLAYANCVELTEILKSTNAKRKISIDSSVYGMGKGAGNANTELIANYMNSRYGKSYNINHLLECIDADILPIFQKLPWGYSFNYYLSAIHDCHPSYVKYLVEKKTLSIQAINQLLEEIPDYTKLTYNKELIENAYLFYQNRTIDDYQYYQELRKKIMDKEIVILGPGVSVKEQRDELLKVAGDNRKFVIATNFYPEEFAIDALFISNSKRYSQLVSKVMCAKERNSHLIVMATTNVTEIEGQVDFWFNYSQLLSKESELVNDSALALLLKLLKLLKVSAVSLAGFDGFSHKENYYDSYYEFDFTEDRANQINGRMRQMIEMFSQDIEISFLTKTKYI